MQEEVHVYPGKDWAYPNIHSPVRQSNKAGVLFKGSHSSSSRTTSQHQGDMQLGEDNYVI